MLTYSISSSLNSSIQSCSFYGSDLWFLNEETLSEMLEEALEEWYMEFAGK